MSAAQLAAFARIFSDSHRPVQPRNGRTVEQSRP
jgi:carbonic anhydrase